MFYLKGAYFNNQRRHNSLSLLNIEETGCELRPKHLAGPAHCGIACGANGVRPRIDRCEKATESLTSRPPPLEPLQRRLRFAREPRRGGTGGKRLQQLVGGRGADVFQHGEDT
jgi:hypothetical protein